MGVESSNQMSFFERGSEAGSEAYKAVHRRGTARYIALMELTTRYGGRGAVKTLAVEPLRALQNYASIMP